MSWIKQKKQQSINQSYNETKDTSKKWKYWENHADESFYDPTYDFRKTQKPVRKKISLFGRKKKIKKDKYEEGRERVKKLIKN